MNLSDYTLPQLHRLNTRIAKELDRRQSASRLDLLERMRRLAAEAGLSLDDLRLDAAAMATGKVRAPRASGSARRPLPVKYRNPNRLSVGWSGRGRRPAWIAAWLANGGTLDALANAAEKFNARSPAPG